MIQLQPWSITMRTRIRMAYWICHKLTSTETVFNKGHTTLAILWATIIKNLALIIILGTTVVKNLALVIILGTTIVKNLAPVIILGTTIIKNLAPVIILGTTIIQNLAPVIILGTIIIKNLALVIILGTTIIKNLRLVLDSTIVLLMSTRNSRNKIWNSGQEHQHRPISIHHQPHQDMNPPPYFNHHNLTWQQDNKLHKPTVIVIVMPTHNSPTTNGTSSATDI